MNTTQNQTVRITGYVASKGICKITERAAMVNLETVDGERFSHSESTWLAKSIATAVKFETVEEDGYATFQFAATVPAWWVRKLDTRAAWQIAGHRSAPMAQQPR